MRYYLHIQNQTSLTIDEEGRELSDVDAARHEAARAAGDILTDEINGGNASPKIEIQVENSSGRVMTLNLSATLASTDGATP